MTIKPNHRHVDMQGCCFLPYLHEWKAESNVLGLVDMVSMVFSAEPPLFSRPQGSLPTNTSGTLARPAVSNPSPTTTTAAIPAVVATPITTTSSAIPSNNSYGTSMNSMIGTPAVNTMNSSVVAAVNPWSTTMSKPTQPTEEEKRTKLLEDVTMRLQEELHKKYVVLRDEMMIEFKNEHDLSNSQRESESIRSQLVPLIAELNQAIESLETKEKDLQTWIDEEANKPKPTAEDQLIVFDDLSQQIIKLQSEINAIDDTLYYMERALIANNTNNSDVSVNKKNIDLQMFLKESRNLARKQFLCKAHLMKIQAYCQANFIPLNTPTGKPIPPPRHIIPPSSQQQQAPLPQQSQQTQPLYSNQPMYGQAFAPQVMPVGQMPVGQVPVGQVPVGSYYPAATPAPTSYHHLPTVPQGPIILPSQGVNNPSLSSQYIAQPYAYPR